MPLGREVGLAPVDIVLDGTQLTFRQRGTKNFAISAHVCCSQTPRWIKMPLRKEAAFGPGDIVLDGDPAPPKGAQPPIFGPCLL